MKVRLLVNLKTVDGKVFAAGEVFSTPLPDFITNNLFFPNIIQVTEDDPTPVVTEEEVVVAEAPKLLKKRRA